MRKAIFLDRDGVINKTFIKNGLRYSPPTFDLLEILPGVKESILRLKKLNFVCLAVTNQPDVLRGKIKYPFGVSCFLRKKIGKFILISNYELFKNYVKKNNINLSFSRIDDPSDIKIISNKYLSIYNIKAEDNIINSYKN